jgi:hypothetical protein
VTLPIVYVETNAEYPLASRVWLEHDEFGRIEITNFCQSVQTDEGSPVVTLRLVAKTDELERSFAIDVNEPDRVRL